MKRSERLWLAFEKFAIFFSFIVVFILVMLALVLAYSTWQVLPTLQALRDEIACPLISDVDGLVADLESVVITKTIPISQTIPVQFDLPIEKNLTVELTQDVDLRRPATMVLPAGGGQINGTVYMVLPRGQDLPVHMKMTVPVSQTLPVEFDVLVAIPRRETELGLGIDRLEELLAPYLDLLDKTLKCSAP